MPIFGKSSNTKLKEQLILNPEITGAFKGNPTAVSKATWIGTKVLTSSDDVDSSIRAMIEEPPHQPKKVFIVVSEHTIGAVDRDHNILQLEEVSGIEKVVTDPNDPHLLGYIVFNERLQSRRVHCFGIKSHSDLKNIKSALPADMTDAEAAAARAPGKDSSATETISAKYLGSAPITSESWGQQDFVMARMALCKSRDPKKQLSALVECAGYLLSEALKARLADGNENNNDIPNAVMMVSPDTFRVLNELTSERYASARPSDVIEVRVMEMPSDRRKAKASVLSMKKGDIMGTKGFSMPQKSLLTIAERGVIMDRVKSGEISMDEAMEIILDAEKEHAEQEEERLVMVCWKNEKHHLIHTEVFLASKQSAEQIQHAIKGAKNKYDTARKGPFLKVTHKAPLPDPRLEPFNISRACLVAVKHVGNGQFGDVYLANMSVSQGEATQHGWNDAGVDEDGYREIQCAVKTLRPKSTAEDQDQFVDECLLQCPLKHESIVEIMGVCMAHSPFLCMLEFALYGDLQQVLQACDHKHIAITELEMLYLLGQLAGALAYLHKERICHIDLASRNCLLFGDMKLKLADFGLARKYTEGRNCWKMTGSLLLPFRQMPPETLAGSLWDPTSKDIFAPKFRENTDVWAYGTVCWEFACNGKELYDDVKVGLMPLMKKIKKGLRLEFPAETPSKLKSVAMRCFDNDAANRPTFAQLNTELMALCEPRMESIRDVGTLINAPLAQRLKNMSTAVTLHTRRTLGGAKRRTLKVGTGGKRNLKGNNAAAAAKAAARAATATLMAEKLDAEAALVRAASTTSTVSREKSVGFSSEGAAAASAAAAAGDGGGDGGEGDGARYRPVYATHDIKFDASNAEVTEAFPAHPDDEAEASFPDFQASTASGDFGFGEGNSLVVEDDGRVARTSSAHFMHDDDDDSDQEEEEETQFNLDRAFSGHQEVEQLDMEDLAQLSERVKRDTMSSSAGSVFAGIPGTSSSGWGDLLGLLGAARANSGGMHLFETEGDDEYASIGDDGEVIGQSASRAGVPTLDVEAELSRAGLRSTSAVEDIEEAVAGSGC